MKFAVTSRCADCPKGRYSSIGVTTCTECEPGFYQDESGQVGRAGASSPITDRCVAEHPTGQGPVHDLAKVYQGKEVGGCKWRG